MEKGGALSWPGGTPQMPDQDLGEAKDSRVKRWGHSWAWGDGLHGAEQHHDLQSRDLARWAGRVLWQRVLLAPTFRHQLLLKVYTTGTCLSPSLPLAS